MWRVLKILIFLWPVAILVYFFNSNFLDQVNVDEKLSDPNGLVWGSDAEQIRVRVEKTFAGEQKIYTIILIGHDSQILEKNIFAIDGDEFGGGFVKAVQADNDQQLELIAWGHHEGGYLLDYSSGKISKISFQKASDEMQQLATNWYQVHVEKRFRIFLLVVSFIAYYIIVGGIIFIIKIIRRRRELARE